MGNYQEYMQSLVNIGAAPLREIEPPAAKVHAFGNPFKKADKSMAVDEVRNAGSWIKLSVKQNI